MPGSSASASRRCCACCTSSTGSRPTASSRRWRPSTPSCSIASSPAIGVRRRRAVALTVARRRVMSSQLRALEADSIHIIREVAAEFARPVMLYSIGKDSSVLLRLAQKAFYPAPIPFPLLHIDTTYKFREMIEFRDHQAVRASAHGLIVAHQHGGDRPGHTAVRRRHTALLRAAQDEGAARRAAGRRIRRGVRRGATRRGTRARQGARLLAARSRSGQWDPKRQRPELWRLLNSRLNPGRERARLPAVELDRSSTCGTTSRPSAFPSSRSTSPRSATSSSAARA